MTSKIKKISALCMSCIFAFSMMATTAFAQDNAIAQDTLNEHVEFVAVPIADGSPQTGIELVNQIVHSDVFESTLETTVFVFLNDQVLSDINASGYLYSVIAPQHLTKLQVDGKLINVVDEATVNNILSSKPVTQGNARICFHSYKNSGSPSYVTQFTKDRNKSCRQKFEIQYQECSKCGAGKTTQKIIQEFPHEWPSPPAGRKCTVCGIV